MSSFEPVNDNGADAEATPGQDRRVERRRRVLLTGKLVYPHSGLTLDCTIRDLTPNGARISVTSALVSDDPFLIVIKHAVAHQSKATWQGGGEAGLRFVDSLDLVGETPLHARRMQRIWRALAWS